MSSNATAPTSGSNKENVAPTSPTTSTTPQVQSSAPTAAAAASGAGGGASGFSSMADLKARAPEVYKAMTQAIAMNVCSDSQHWSDKIKEAMQEGEDKNP